MRIGQAISRGDTFEANTQPDIYMTYDATMQCYDASGDPSSGGMVTCTVRQLILRILKHNTCSGIPVTVYVKATLRDKAISIHSQSPCICRLLPPMRPSALAAT